MQARAHKRSGYTRGQRAIMISIVVFALIIVVLILFGKSKIFPWSSTSTSGTSKTVQTTTDTSSDTSQIAILTPATVAPKVNECKASVTYASNGAPSPLQCPNGDINLLAWTALAAQEPKVMSLGYSPSQSALQQAVCSDINAAASDSAPGADDGIEESAYTISSIYYGWAFQTSAATLVSSC